MARPIVRAASGIVLTKRVNVDKATIPDISAADFDNPLTFDLLACTEAQDESIESTGGTTAGTDVAVTPLYSRLLSLRLHAIIQGTQATANLYRWILAKSPDNDITGATFMSNWMSSDDTTAAREVREHIMAKGLAVINQSSGNAFPRIFVKKKTLNRLSPLREDDRIKFIIAKDAPGTTANFTMWGNLWVRANA